MGIFALENDGHLSCSSFAIPQQLQSTWCTCKCIYYAFYNSPSWATRIVKTRER